MPASCAVSFVSGQEPLRTGDVLSLPPGQHQCSLRWCPSRPGSMRGTLVLLWRGHCRLQVGPPAVCLADLSGPALKHCSFGSLREPAQVANQCEWLQCQACCQWWCQTWCCLPCQPHVCAQVVVSGTATASRSGSAPPVEAAASTADMGRAGSVPKLSLVSLLPEVQVQIHAQQSRCGTGKAATMAQQGSDAPLRSNENAPPEAGKQMPGPAERACPGHLLRREGKEHDASSPTSQRLGSECSRAGRLAQLRHGGQQQDASSPATQRLGPASSQAGHSLQLSAREGTSRRGQWTPRGGLASGPAPGCEIQLTPRRTSASAAQSMGFAQLGAPPAASAAPIADGRAAGQLNMEGCATSRAGAASAATPRGGRTASMAGLSPVQAHLALQLPLATPRSADRPGAGGALTSRTPAAALGTSSFARFHTQ